MSDFIIIVTICFYYFRFILELVCNSDMGFGSSPAVLNVIETNPFKHLTHLALKFCAGTDVDVKRYLAECLKNLKVLLSNKETFLEILKYHQLQNCFGLFTFCCPKI